MTTATTTIIIVRTWLSSLISILKLMSIVIVVVPQLPSSYGFTPISSQTSRRSLSTSVSSLVSCTTTTTTTAMATILSPFRRTTSPIFATTTTTRMVRNIDLVEALFFYGDDSIFFSTSEEEQDRQQDQYQLLPGVSSLIEECIRDETAIIMLLDHHQSPSVSSSNDQQQENEFQRKKQLVIDSAPSLSKNPNLLYLRESTVIPPNPADLYCCINDDDDDEEDAADDDKSGSSGCITIQPKGFGGSAGFGTKNADPERPPLPRHCVVLCTTIEQCRAARSVGMRCLSLVDNDIADAVVGYAIDVDDIDPLDGWSSITMDDIATPGSFWLNVCHPRDDEGNKADPIAIINSYSQEQLSQVVDEDGDSDSSNYDGANVDDNHNNNNNNDEPSDDELAAILADMDPL